MRFRKTLVSVVVVLGVAGGVFSVARASAPDLEFDAALSHPAPDVISTLPKPLRWVLPAPLAVIRACRYTSDARGRLTVRSHADIRTGLDPCAPSWRNATSGPQDRAPGPRGAERSGPSTPCTSPTSPAAPPTATWPALPAAARPPLGSAPADRFRLRSPPSSPVSPPERCCFPGFGDHR